MPNKAANWRAKLATELGYEPNIVSRTEGSITAKLGPNRYRSLFMSGKARLHRPDGTEVDTDLVTDTNPEYLRALLQDMGIKIGPQGKQVITPRPDHPAETVVIERPMWFRGPGQPKWRDVPFDSWSVDEDSVVTFSAPDYDLRVRITTQGGIRTKWAAKNIDGVFATRWPYTLTGLHWEGRSLVSDADSTVVVSLLTPGCSYPDSVMSPPTIVSGTIEYPAPQGPWEMLREEEWPVFYG